jgi:hypothetical protein
MDATAGGIPMNKLGCTLLSLLAVALVLGVGTATAQDNDYYVGYFANANASGAPTAHLRLSNDGAYSADDDPENLCAAIYVFDTAEEMQECCSCVITPDGYLDLTVNSNLLGNPLDHGTTPTRGIIKVVSTTLLSGACLPTRTGHGATNGIKGWLTHVEKGATAGTFSLTETPLTDSALTADEFDFNLQDTCGFVQSLGTGTGVCSCTDAGD